MVDGPTNGLSDGEIYGQSDGWTDQPKEGRADSQMDGQTDVFTGTKFFLLLYQHFFSRHKHCVGNNNFFRHPNPFFSSFFKIIFAPQIFLGPKTSFATIFFSSKKICQFFFNQSYSGSNSFSTTIFFLEPTFSLGPTFVWDQI